MTSQQQVSPAEPAKSGSRVLVLGGTSEGRAVVPPLAAHGFEVISSLAGRVADPKLPQGQVRTGGFGGAEGLASYLRAEKIDHVVDATHPYAVTISTNAVTACQDAGVPLVRLVRPSWAEQPQLQPDTWHWVDSYEQSRKVGALLGRHPFITTGRQTLQHYVTWRRLRVLARVVTDVDFELPASWSLIRDRGPYSVQSERDLMHEHDIDVLITKDSGGQYTSAKLEAAHRLGVAVVVVRRPKLPKWKPCVSTVPEAVDEVIATHENGSEPER